MLGLTSHILAARTLSTPRIAVFSESYKPLRQSKHYVTNIPRLETTSSLVELIHQTNRRTRNSETRDSELGGEIIDFRVLGEVKPAWRR